MRHWIAIALAALAATGTAASAQRGPIVVERVDDRPWYKQPWNAANARACDRACLVAIGDAYMRALETKDRGDLPLAEVVAMTENTGAMQVGEGLLWRETIAPTPFRITIADPVQGQIAYQVVLQVGGRPAMVAVRLRVEREMITEVEQLYDRNVAPQAMELLTTPRPMLLADVPADERLSRELLAYAAESYFDALTGEDGTIAPFSEDCVRHEQGYRTVNNDGPGRATPSPNLPDPNTEIGRFFIQLSQMTCAEQVSLGVFNGIKRIWPRRALVIDQQKGLVATFPFFVHDGTRRPVTDPALPRPGSAAGMVINLATMEVFGIRDGQIHEVEAFPFVTIPYGTGNGWSNAPTD